ncbi:MAG: ribosome biogenesis GTPase YlqF [Fusobacteria bacterium]|nr:ribosome biogenesis GTPase YlqF [Fusobacteriota bacterium]
MTKVNWYPGHMKKTKDLISENISAVDLILDVRDARVYISSANPDLKSLAGVKNRIVILNKSDLVEQAELSRISGKIIAENPGVKVVAISAEKGTNIKNMNALIEGFRNVKVERMLKKGLKKTSFRIMIVGIPNVGKSKLINTLAKRKAAGVGNKPGFTRGKQWISLPNGIELLDTPGVLWPNFDNIDIGMKLSIILAIREDILDRVDTAKYFLLIAKKMGFLKSIYTAYKLEYLENEPDYLILEKVAKHFHMLLKGEVLDVEKASYKLLIDYREMKLGKFPLE